MKTAKLVGEAGKGDLFRVARVERETRSDLPQSILGETNHLKLHTSI